MTFTESKYVGEQFGKWKIIRCVGKNERGYNLYDCKCTECGLIETTRIQDIKAPLKVNQTCSKHLMKMLRQKSSPAFEDKRLLNIFDGMYRRCFYKSDKDYRFYGERGVKVCDEWVNNPKKFEEWALANGYFETGTIDRIDSSKNYCPENCRWISSSDNSKYKSTTQCITVNGETHTGKDWDRALGITINTINKMRRELGEEYVKEYITERMCKA